MKPSRIKRERFKESIRNQYRKLVESGMDPHVAKLRILRSRRKVSSLLTIQQLRDILYRK